MKPSFQIAASCLLSCIGFQASAMANMPGYFVFEGGIYFPSEGQSQDIPIEGLIGDYFTVDNQTDVASIFGAGFLFKGIRHNNFGLDYGVNFFYLAKTQVSGDIEQELIFNNLSYEYTVSHLPVYAVAKAFWTMPESNLSFTFDIGVGPNFMTVNNYQDWSNDGTSIPDNAFSGSDNHSTVYSAMAGVGVKINNLTFPLEFGYRFFYLGEGSLEPRTDQILDDLKTGKIYANALFVTLSL